MADFNRKYNKHKEEIPPALQRFREGCRLVREHPLFGNLHGNIYEKNTHLAGKGCLACVTPQGQIFVQPYAGLSPEEWAYVLAHCLLHLAFGHFDNRRTPAPERYIPWLWNKACDIYIAGFLADIGFGRPVFPDPSSVYSGKLSSELRIYDELLSAGLPEAPSNEFGLNSLHYNDMIGIEHPVRYKEGEINYYTDAFSRCISRQARAAVGAAGSSENHVWNEKKDTPALQAAEWFLTRYPLLGGLAASFRIIEDVTLCHRQEIRVAAVDAFQGEIYVNPACGFSLEEWKFVLAHEYLHAGLQHHRRCQGRDPFLWNVACDFVINDWLVEMKIGKMPEIGALYDEQFHGMSAESVYDRLIGDMRKYRKSGTFRGYGQGDVIRKGSPVFERGDRGICADDFFRQALSEGLDWHLEKGRGFLPAGLVEEIRALAVPPIPWDVALGHWFDENFPPVEVHRTYARASRRQASSPDIPRPGRAIRKAEELQRTFGVLIDTSGSMSARELGLALGAAASYASAKDVAMIRVIFCDAAAYDAGYVSADDLAGSVRVTGRGGTVLQPGIDFLLRASDFPRDAPVLIITDGKIESRIKISRNHAWLLPKGCRLPFPARGPVFYFS